MKIPIALLIALLVPTSSGFGNLLGATDNMLTVEEYRLIPASEDIYTYIATTKMKRILEKRRPWRKANNYNDIATIKSYINDYGYNLRTAKNNGYDLLFRDNLLLGDLIIIRCFSRNEANSDFLFTAIQRGQGIEKPRTLPRILVMKNGVTDWTGFYCPIFHDDRMLSISIIRDCPSPECIPTFHIRRGEEVLYTFSVPFIVDFPVKNFLSWNNKWILEYKDRVIIDGRSLNDEMDYAKVFSYRILNGVPFFFYEKDKLIFLSYDNQALKNSYDEVMHYLCCDASVLNIESNSTMIWFYAIRDGYWYYVEAGIYN